MAVKSQQIVTSFDGGIYSPLFWYRADKPKWGSSVRESLNWLIMPQGPALMRPGFEYIAETRFTNPDTNKRLFNFEWASYDYLIEMGHYYMRFYRFGEYIGEVTTPWPADKIDEVQYAQKRNIVVMVHLDYPPQVVYREDDTEKFRINPLSINSYPQHDFNDEYSPEITDSQYQISFSAATNNDTYTMTYGAETTPFISYSSNILTNVDRIQSALQELPNISSETTVTVTGTGAVEGPYNITISGPESGLGLTAAAVSMDNDPTIVTVDAGGSRREDGWSELRGWPSTVTFFEERLVMAASIFLPEWIWFSATADYLDFDQIGAAYPSDPIALPLDSVEQVVVRWLRGGSEVLVGASTGHFRIGNSSGPVTPSNVVIEQMTSERSDRTQPTSLHSEVIYVSDGRETLRNLFWSDERQSGLAVDLSWAISHLTEASLGQPFKMTRPEDMVITVNASGDLLVLSYDMIQGVAGWSRQQHANGRIVKATACREPLSDSIYAVVERDGRSYIERMRTDLYQVTGTERFGWYDLPYLDSCVDQTFPAPVTTVTGLKHLNGVRCQVVVDGIVHEDRVPSAGQITLDFPGTHVIVGLQYENKLQTQETASGSPRGVAFGQKRKWSRLFLNIVEAARPEVNGSKAEDRTPATPMNTAEPAFTGPVEYRLSGWAGGILTIENPYPLGCCVASIFGEVVTASEA